MLIGSFFRNIAHSFLRLSDIASARVEKYGARYISFGAFSLINYILPFYMWSEHHSSDPVVLSIRIIAGILNFFLIMHETWYPSLKRYLALYWYFTVMFSLPFFAGYMLLLEQFSVFWIINISLALVISLIVLDIKTFFFIFPLGIACAVGLAWSTGVGLGAIKFANVPFQVVYLMVFSGAVAVFFSRNREQIELEKIDTLRGFGATIAHEMRTPLSTIALRCKLIKRYRNDKEKILDNVDKISQEVSETLLTIDMILTKLKKQPNYTGRKSMNVLSMRDCVQEAIDRYPFFDNEKASLEFNQNEDFEFVGYKGSVVHILFNLIQNALYQIRKSNKGKIIISMKRGKASNILSVKDDATGVEPELIDKLFTPMVSNKFFGTGLGLSFCKNAMEAMNGTIRCNSVDGKFAEFIMEFPRVTTSKVDKLKSLINIKSR